ncbi:MAG: hypothetical protein MUE63_03815 [Xanthomonadales bacterium]|nr:hypothetical protein [Xanthomonadales bacterium]
MNNRKAMGAGFRVLRMMLCLGGCLCAPAWADVTIEGTHSPGFSGGVDRQVIYLRDDQMRIDQLAQGGSGADSVASTLLIRFSGRPAGLLHIDHGAGTVQVLSALPPTNAADSALDPAANPVRVERRDETWEILGHTARRHDFSFSGNVDPLVLLGGQLPPGMAGMASIRLDVSGTSWVAPGMDGAAELAGFFAALTGKQLAVALLGQDPFAMGQAGSVVSPGLSRAITEVMAQITREGLPLVTETRSMLRVDMVGTVADMIRALLAGMGLDAPQSTESIVTRVSTATVPAELFYSGGLPAAYTLHGTAGAAEY